jgi:hypothetical protein
MDEDEQHLLVNADRAKTTLPILLDLAVAKPQATVARSILSLVRAAISAWRKRKDVEILSVKANNTLATFARSFGVKDGIYHWNGLSLVAKTGEHIATNRVWRWECFEGSMRAPVNVFFPNLVDWLVCFLQFYHCMASNDKKTWPLQTKQGIGLAPPEKAIKNFWLMIPHHEMVINQCCHVIFDVEKISTQAMESFIKELAASGLLFFTVTRLKEAPDTWSCHVYVYNSLKKMAEKAMLKFVPGYLKNTLGVTEFEIFGGMQQKSPHNLRAPFCVKMAKSPQDFDLENTAMDKLTNKFMVPSAVWSHPDIIKLAHNMTRVACKVCKKVICDKCVFGSLLGKNIVRPSGSCFCPPTECKECLTRLIGLTLMFTCRKPLSKNPLTGEKLGYKPNDLTDEAFETPESLTNDLHFSTYKAELFPKSTPEVTWHFSYEIASSTIGSAVKRFLSPSQLSKLIRSVYKTLCKAIFVYDGKWYGVVSERSMRQVSENTYEVMRDDLIEFKRFKWEHLSGIKSNSSNLLSRLTQRFFLSPKHGWPLDIDKCSLLAQAICPYLEICRTDKDSQNEVINSLTVDWVRLLGSLEPYTKTIYPDLTFELVTPFASVKLDEMGDHFNSVIQVAVRNDKHRSPLSTPFYFGAELDVNTDQFTRLATRLGFILHYIRQQLLFDERHWYQLWYMVIHHYLFPTESPMVHLFFLSKMKGSGKTLFATLLANLGPNKVMAAVFEHKFFCIEGLWAVVVDEFAGGSSGNLPFIKSLLTTKTHLDEKKYHTPVEVGMKALFIATANKIPTKFKSHYPIELFTPQSRRFLVVPFRERKLQTLFHDEHYIKRFADDCHRASILATLQYLMVWPKVVAERLGANGAVDLPVSIHQSAIESVLQLCQIVVDVHNREYPEFLQRPSDYCWTEMIGHRLLKQPTMESASSLFLFYHYMARCMVASGIVYLPIKPYARYPQFHVFSEERDHSGLSVTECVPFFDTESGINTFWPIWMPWELLSGYLERVYDKQIKDHAFFSLPGFRSYLCNTGLAMEGKFNDIDGLRFIPHTTAIDQLAKEVHNEKDALFYRVGIADFPKRINVCPITFKALAGFDISHIAIAPDIDTAIGRDGFIDHLLWRSSKQFYEMIPRCVKIPVFEEQCFISDYKMSKDISHYRPYIPKTASSSSSSKRTLGGNLDDLRDLFYSSKRCRTSQ